MLKLTGEKLSSFDAVIAALHSKNVEMNYSAVEILADGDLHKLTSGGLMRQDYGSLENFKKKDGNISIPNEKKNEPQSTLIVEKGGATNIKANYPRKFKETDSRHNIKSWQVWRADFGKPIGKGEYGYLHYVVVFCEGDKPDSFIVFPCTSKYQEQDSVYQIKFTKDNLLEYDEEFLEKSKVTYVLFNLQSPIDISRFEKCVGTLSDEVISEMLIDYKSAREELSQRAIRNVDLGKAKKELTIETLNLNRFQMKMIEDVCETDILIIANNTNYSYDKKVNALVNAFKIPTTDDGELLIDLIKRCKNLKKVNLQIVMESMSKRKKIPYKQLRNKIISHYVGKNSKRNERCLVDFVNLINILAS